MKVSTDSNFWQKKVARESRTQASAIRKFRVTAAFTLPEGVDQELVKKCALKKIALAFATFKKKLYINYIKKDKEPNWDDLPQVKPYWEEFKQYKLSEEAQGKSEQAKTNAAKKYNHHLRVGGYKKAVKKWQKMEQDLMDRGIRPTTWD